MRRPVPTVKSLEPVIRRESRYHARKFRGVLGADDLAQEGRIIAMKAVDAYDPARGKPETLLTDMLREHYRRLCKHVLTRALIYTDQQRKEVIAHVRIAPTDPLKRINARLLLARLARLPADEQRLAQALIEHGGTIARVAKQMRWSRGTTYTRVAALRSLLTK